MICGGRKIFNAFGASGVWMIAYLLVHVIEQFTSTILIDDTTIAGFERVDQMPMPMMKVDAHVFTEVPQTMFFFKIRCGVVSSVEKFNRVHKLNVKSKKLTGQ